ncbi:hypothetical protein D9M70_510090 [compost metagenome]
MDVGRHRHIHHLRVRQLEVVHQVDIFVDGFHPETWIEVLLFADGRNRVALVVVRRVDERLVRQLQELVEDRVILLARVAVLEIRAPGAADQERVTGKDPPPHVAAHQEGIGIVGMAGRIEHVEAETLDRHPVALRNPHGNDVGRRLLAHHGDAMGLVAQRPEPGDVIGMEMGIDRLDQPEVEFADELQVTLDLFQYRIDDQRLAALAAGDQVGIGAGHAVEQLTEDHRRLLG